MSSYEKNKQYEIEIEDLTAEGMGVGKTELGVMFVPETVPGDRVLAKAIKVNKTYSFGRLEAILEASADRVIPPCTSYKRCGGCNIMHMSYEAQLKWKRKLTEDAICRIGGFKNVKIAETEGMENGGLEYRNKTQMPVGHDKDGNIIWGFFAHGTHEIIQASNCRVAHLAAKKIMKAVVKYMRECGILPYDEKNHSGKIRNVYLRSNYRNEIAVTIVINAKGLKQEDKLIEAILKSYDKISGIMLNFNTKRTNVVMGAENRILYGSDKMTDKLGSLMLDISPHSFYQINRVQAEKLYEKGVTLLNLNGNECVFDLYSGIGSIGLYMADRVREVVGVEIVPQAVKNAEENAKKNEIENSKFYVGAAENIVPVLYSQGQRADVVILDPPRKGADEKLLNTVIDMNPDKILYISCNPATLARDLKCLTENHAYQFDTVFPFDLFPHTTHVECVVCMQRKDTL